MVIFHANFVVGVCHDMTPVIVIRSIDTDVFVHCWTSQWCNLPRACEMLSVCLSRMMVNFEIAPHFLHKSYGHQTLSKTSQWCILWKTCVHCNIRLDFRGWIILKINRVRNLKLWAALLNFLTSGHRLLKIIKIQLICSETVKHKLHLSYWSLKLMQY